MKFLQLALPLTMACALAAHAANLPLAGEGQQVFEMRCSVGYCHGVDGRAGKGPRLRDRTWTRAYLYTTIERGIPGSSMPAWKGRLSEHSIDAVISYVLGIGKEQTNAAGAKESSTSEPPISSQAALGKVLFFDLTKDRNCGVCHRIADSGTAIAPAFANLATKSEQDLVNQMLNPPSGVRHLQVITSDGETICGVEAARSAGWLRMYDVGGEGPPVSRTIDFGSIKKLAPCAGLNPHQENIRFYTREELMSLAAFLKSSDASAGHP
jgi:mono/diheme cytochrome c family protein